MVPTTFKAGVELRFTDDGNTSSVGLKGPAILAGPVTFRLPDSDGFNGWVVTTDGAGTLSLQPGISDLIAGINTWTNLQTFSGGLISTSPTIPFGFAAGAGGSVTQLTDKSTAVEINKVCGLITTSNDSLADATNVSFLVENSVVTEEDFVGLCFVDVGTGLSYQAWISGVLDGFFQVTIRNVSGAPQSDAIQIKFVVIKAAIS